jgi:preprotein translocase subunit SecA
MDKLRSTSSLASYAQKNPFQVYTQKGAELFDELIKRISHNAIRALMINNFKGAKENAIKMAAMEQAQELEIEKEIQEKIKSVNTHEAKLETKVISKKKKVLKTTKPNKSIITKSKTAAKAKAATKSKASAKSKK